MPDRTTLIVTLSVLAGALLTALIASPSRAGADGPRTAVGFMEQTLPGVVLAHCEVPCGIYDDNMMVRQMLLDAETIRKASAKIVELAERTDAASLNTIARWVLVKEEHSRELQHRNAWYFMTQRVKAVPADDPGHAAYLERLAAHHRISVAAMKAAQSLDTSVQAELTRAIKAVEPWYPPNDAGASLPAPDENWIRVGDASSP